MVPNCEVDILAGTPTENGWGDTVISESLFATVAGHIGTDQTITGRPATDKDGMTFTRCRIRIPSQTVLPDHAVFRIDGVRWKPVSGKVSRILQLFAIYECQRID